MPGSILVATTDFSGDLEERSLGAVGTGKAVLASDGSRLWVLSLSYTRHCQGEQLPLPKPQKDLYLAGLRIPAGTSQHSRLGQQHVAQIFPESNHKTGISYEHLNEKKRKEREEKPPRAQRTQIRLLGMDRQQLTKFLYFIFSTFLNTRHCFPPSLNTPVPSWSK